MSEIEGCAKIKGVLIVNFYMLLLIKKQDILIGRSEIHTERIR